MDKGYGSRRVPSFVRRPCGGLEITSTWPDGVWALRDYLLSKSPYLSITSLRELIIRPGVPDAIKTEICIANPEATRSEGFVAWLMRDQLLPEYLIGSIVASWDTRTYRYTLENDLSDHHFRMTYAANDLLEIYSTEGDGVRGDSLLYTWRRVRTPSARYAEALMLLEYDDFVGAREVIEDIPIEHRLDPRELDERGRMLWFIDALEDLHSADRHVAELDNNEVAAWQAVITDHHDRPSVWISNLLCYYHGICRAPLTGGEGTEPKALPYTPPASASFIKDLITLFPNPASAWVAINYELLSGLEERTWLRLKDALGRELQAVQLKDTKGQVVLDTRVYGTGVYTLELVKGQSVVQMERLVVQ